MLSLIKKREWLAGGAIFLLFGANLATALDSTPRICYAPQNTECPVPQTYCYLRSFAQCNSVGHYSEGENYYSLAPTSNTQIDYQTNAQLAPCWGTCSACSWDTLLSTCLCDNKTKGFPVGHITYTPVVCVQ